MRTAALLGDLAEIFFLVPGCFFKGGGFAADNIAELSFKPC